MNEKVSAHIDMLLEKIPYPRFMNEKEAEAWQYGFKSALITIKSVAEESSNEPA